MLSSDDSITHTWPMLSTEDSFTHTWPMLSSEDIIIIIIKMHLLSAFTKKDHSVLHMIQS